MFQFHAEFLVALTMVAASVKATPPDDIDPRIEIRVDKLIGRVAEKWTMLLSKVLGEHGELRFTRLSRLVPGMSQKMLTQTVRLMERDGLLMRTAHAVVSPEWSISSRRPA